MTEKFAHYGPTPPNDFLTLANVGKPEELCTILTKRGHGLGIVSCMDSEETLKTFAAMNRTFEDLGERVTSLRVGNNEPVPGTTEIHSNDTTGSVQALMRWGSDRVIILDSLDTKEKLIAALDASLVGTIVVASVPALSVWGAIDSILSSVPEVNRYLLSEALAYVAHQRVRPDEYCPGNLVQTDIVVVDEGFKTAIMEA
jgi:hypothetical protein